MERRLVPETIGDPNAERNLVWRPSVLLNELVRQLEDASDKEIHGWWRASNFFSLGSFHGNRTPRAGDDVEVVVSEGENREETMLFIRLPRKVL